MRRGLGLYLKGLIATGKQDKKLGPWFTASGIGGTVAANDVCFTRKSRTKQNPNPNGEVAAIYEDSRVV